MRHTAVGVYLACAWILAPAASATCSTEKHPETTPTERFTLVDGMVQDKDTGLMWMRCAIGQAWDGKTCVGEAGMYSWSDTAAAKDQLNETGYAGHSDWRVPMVPELASIVELQCFNPRVNVEVFPATPSEGFWTSMEKMGTQEYAYMLDFGGGEATPQRKDTEGALRLVRGGPWWTPPEMPPKAN